MTYKEWEKLDLFKIDESYTFEKADSDQFCIYNEIYSKLNSTTFEDASWSPTITNKSLELIKENYKQWTNYTFWIKKDNLIIGGAVIGPNYLYGLFVIPIHSSLEKSINPLKTALVVMQYTACYY